MIRTLNLRTSRAFSLPERLRDFVEVFRRLCVPSALVRAISGYLILTGETGEIVASPGRVIQVPQKVR